MNNYLEVSNLSKSFNGFRLRKISFTLPKGFIMGLIGSNGSEKTTIKLILTCSSVNSEKSSNSRNQDSIFDTI